jgi:hypothetical protein
MHAKPISKTGAIGKSCIVTWARSCKTHMIVLAAIYRQHLHIAADSVFAA